MNWKHFIFCLSLVSAHLFYTVWFPSIVNGERYYLSSHDFVSPEYITAFHESRSRFAEFARRPITTWLIDATEEIGIPTSKAFLLVEYAGLGLSLLLLFRLSFHLSGSTKAANWSVILFITQFWVLHAFFAQIYAYDEPWQYVFLLLMLEMLLQKKWFWLNVFLSLALLARESTLLLIPGIVFAFIIRKPIANAQNAKVLWPIAAACLLYFGFLGYWISSHNLASETLTYSENERWRHLSYSFAHWDIGIDTLMSLALSFALPLTLIGLSNGVNSSERFWRKAFWISFAINTPITLFFAMGREARIFAQPLIFLSPFLGMHLHSVIGQIKTNIQIAKSRPSNLKFVIWFITMLLFFCLASLIAQELYWPTDTMFWRGFQLYAYFSFVVIGLMVFFQLRWLRLPKFYGQRLLIGMLIFTGALYFTFNQKGFKFYQYYAQISTASKNVVIVNTEMPNLARKFLSRKSKKIIAGNFNRAVEQKEVMTFLDDTNSQNILYAELLPLFDFPLKYALATTSSNAIMLENNQNLELISFEIDDEDQSLSDTILLLRTKNYMDKFKEEFGPTLKIRLGELGIDTLHTIGATTYFDDDSLPERASLVISVSLNNELLHWQSIPLIKCLSEEPRLVDQAWIFADLGSLTNDNTEISVYLWNPDLKPIWHGNMRVDINSPWSPSKPEPRDVLSSRNLR